MLQSKKYSDREMCSVNDDRPSSTASAAPRNSPSTVDLGDRRLVFKFSFLPDPSASEMIVANMVATGFPESSRRKQRFFLHHDAPYLLVEHPVPSDQILRSHIVRSRRSLTYRLPQS